MRVVLLNHTPEPDKTVALAARLCYSDCPVEELGEKIDPETAARLIRSLFQMGHLSPFEHASFTFGISGVSRALTHQLVRHRIASYSQRSQRYISEEGFEFVIPPTIKKIPRAREIYEEQMKAIRQTYETLLGMHVPKEDARYVLPNACHTQIVCTFNARSLLNFFELRCCMRAQWEIRVVAYRMLRQVRRVAPSIFEKAGPRCVTSGVCNQGKLSCGRLEKLRASKQGVSLS